MSYQTEQEQFWASEFGTEYIQRNCDQDSLHRLIGVFFEIISFTPKINSALEFGANIGQNLRALQFILPQIKLSAIEINESAVGYLQKLGLEKIYHQSILDFTPDHVRDLVMICGVLIHINPEALPQVYEKLYRSSKQYLLISEYYNPTPVEIPYRGHRNKLFKRDFAGEMMDQFPDLKLVAYRFIYHRDPLRQGGDQTWFLLEKT